MPQLCIPKKGDVLQLTAPWVFEVYNVHLNATLVEFLKPKGLLSADYEKGAVRAFKATIPAGARLKVDLLVWDSDGPGKIVCFLEGAKAKVPISKAHNPFASKEPSFANRQVRFFASLQEANSLQFNLISKEENT